MLDELNTYTLQELYKQPIEPIPWVVEDLLAPGLYFLGGSPKVGKSWLALQLCLAVCQGEPFLGFKTRRTEVLYISLEDGPRRLHTRALRLTEEAPAGLHLCGHAPMIGQGLEQQLDRMLAEHPGIRLVIIDTLQKVRMVAGANASYGNDYQDAAALKELADRCNVCLLVIHHLRKMPDEDPFNRLSGTNGLTGAADGTIILIRQKRQEGTALLTATGRDIEDRELTLEFSDCCLPLASFSGLPQSWWKSWDNRALYGVRPSFPGIFKATRTPWRRREFCWTQSAATTNGFCFFA